MPAVRRCVNKVTLTFVDRQVVNREGRTFLSVPFLRNGTQSSQGTSHAHLGSITHYCFRDPAPPCRRRRRGRQLEGHPCRGWPTRQPLAASHREQRRQADRRNRGAERRPRFHASQSQGRRRRTAV